MFRVRKIILANQNKFVENLGSMETPALRPWSHGLRPKKLYARVAMPPATVLTPRQWPLALSIASVG